jgi:hypothetical protein
MTAQNRLHRQYRVQSAGTFTEVSANTTSEQSLTVLGVRSGDMVTVNKPTHQAGLGVVGARVNAADTVALTFMNNTGSGITPTAETYNVHVFRSEGVQLSAND